MQNVTFSLLRTYLDYAITTEKLQIQTVIIMMMVIKSSRVPGKVRFPFTDRRPLSWSCLDQIDIKVRYLRYYEIWKMERYLWKIKEQYLRVVSLNENDFGQQYHGSTINWNTAVKQEIGFGIFFIYMIHFFSVPLVWLVSKK